MTVITHKRNLLDALFIEPIELIISQPHQALISSASIFLVAAEAGMLIEWPYNVLMGIGAEWAYLRGFSTGQRVRTGWAVALNWSAVMLVVLYGSLWGMRRFGVPLPSEGYAVSGFWPIASAVFLTLIHILSIGAVTLCSAMVHSAAVRAEREEAERTKAIAETRERQNQAITDAIERDKARAKVELEIEVARKRADLGIWEAGQQAKMQMQDARKKMQGNARPVPANADEKICPKCGIELDRAHWLAARRWGYCAACKEV